MSVFNDVIFILAVCGRAARRPSITSVPWNILDGSGPTHTDHILHSSSRHIHCMSDHPPDTEAAKALRDHQEGRVGYRAEEHSFVSINSWFRLNFVRVSGRV